MSSSPTKLTLTRFAVFFALALTIWLVGTRVPPWLSSLDNGEAGVDETNTPLIDEQGRNIIFVGEVELRIPDEVRHLTYRPVKPYEIFELVFCWPNVPTNNDCADYKSRLRVYLQARSSSHEFPFNDADIVIARNTETYGEPIEMANPQVKKYEIKPGSSAAYFVITRLRESGRFPMARCYGSNCKVGFTPQPGLRVTYEFWQSHIDDWQSIDQFVTSRIDEFTLEN